MNLMTTLTELKQSRYHVSKNVSLFIWFPNFIFNCWGTISEIDTTITASGKITTVVPNVEVQSNYNSVVKEILVKKGESVNQGDPLVTFDATLQKADKMKLNYQLSVINSKIDRLKKQSLLRNNISVKNPNDERQSRIFKDKKDQYLAKIASLDQQIGSTEDDLKFIKEQLDIQKQLEDSKFELFELRSCCRISSFS